MGSQLGLQVGLIAIVGAIGLAMLAVEYAHPGRKFPTVPGWLIRAIAINAVQVGSIVAAGLLWNGWMRHHQVWSADGFGTIGGALFGYLALTFVFYWWHVARHRSDFLWRWLHQMHHSAQRLELLTAFYKRPAEIVTDSLISSALLYVVLGLQPMAAAFAMVLSGLANFSIIGMSKRPTCWDSSSSGRKAI